jgi:polysaccharide export outer membrane protein
MMHKLKIALLACVIMIFGCSTPGIKKDVSVVSPEEVPEKIKPVRLSEFTIGPGDTIEIMVWRHNDLSKKIRVDQYGRLVYPPIGEIEVNGISISRLRDIIKEGLSKYFVDPKVSISVVSIYSQKVYVLGEVKRPGVFNFTMPIRAIEAVSLAGGFTPDAKGESVIVIRGDRKKPELIRLDLESVFKGGNIKQNIYLQAGDIVYVPSTYISDVSKFARYLSDILKPVLMLEAGIIRSPRVEDIIQ